MFKSHQFYSDFIKKLVTENFGIPRKELDQWMLKKFISTQMTHPEVFEDLPNTSFLTRLCIEEDYLSSQRKIVFVDNKTADFLLNLKFSLKNLDFLYRVSDSVMLCPQKNYTNRSFKIYPAISVIETMAEKIKSIQKIFQKYTSTEECELFTSKFIGEKGISKEDMSKRNINLTFQSSPRNNVALDIDDEQIIQMMKMSLDDCLKPSNHHKVMPLDLANLEIEGEKNIQQKIIISTRLTIAMYLYNAVTEDRYLKKGCPKIFKHSIPDMPKKSKIKKLFIPKGTTNNTVFTRSGHYRQLMADRYYQNEFANYEKGTRWVEVRASVVGKAEAFIQQTK